MNWLKAKIALLFTYLASLVSDGGPSVTRWVFLRTAEVISLGWIAMVTCACIVYIKTGKCDVVFAGMITTLGAGLFAFAQQVQSAKLAIDAKNSGAPSNVTSTPLSSTVETGVKP